MTAPISGHHALGMIDTHSAAAFHPHEVLAEALLARLDPPGTDGALGLSHILRVWRNAAAIAVTEPGCDVELLLAAALGFTSDRVAARLGEIEA